MYVCKNDDIAYGYCLFQLDFKNITKKLVVKDTPEYYLYPI